MGIGLGGAIIGCVVTIAFMVVVTGIIPHAYNQSIVSEKKVNAFCADLKKSIDSTMSDYKLQNITMEYINQYAQMCH